MPQAPSSGNLINTAAQSQPLQGGAALLSPFEAAGANQLLCSALHALVLTDIFFFQCHGQVLLAHLRVSACLRCSQGTAPRQGLLMHCFLDRIAQWPGVPFSPKHTSLVVQEPIPTFLVVMTQAQEQQPLLPPSHPAARLPLLHPGRTGPVA